MRARTWTAITASVIAAVAAGTVGAVATLGHADVAAPGHASATDVAATRAVTPPPPPLTVTSVEHAGDTTMPTLLGAVTVTFSSPVAATVRPLLSPALAGAWVQPSPTKLVFMPTEVPLPLQKLTLTVAAGTQDLAGGVLAAASTTTWTTRAADPARLQQLLAEDGYLPLSFTPAAAEPTTAPALAASAFAPVAGSYAWRFTPPPTLRALFTGTTSSLLTHGALLAFEADHHLAADGIAGPAVWTALTGSLADGARNSTPYTYVLVNKTVPQQLVLYRDGAPVLTTPANTGVAGAQTPDGSWAVYARYTSQTMSGTNPDGTHYSDPGVPWISYFYGGDAVHGFPRASYGTPQSVGCVELPIATAQQVYGLMGYGDIVTVVG
ncbi:MAG TPA: L,D-transpeptidase family protein [Mycobacteriales bacterium]